MKENGQEESTVDGMGEIAASYCQQLFTSNGVADYSRILSEMEVCVSEENNMFLTSPFSRSEIIAALKNMGATKAIGLDGYPCHVFFRNIGL